MCVQLISYIFHVTCMYIFHVSCMYISYKKILTKHLTLFAANTVGSKLLVTKSVYFGVCMCVCVCECVSV